MKISKIVLVAASLAGITQSAWSQKPENTSRHGILGYLDAKTGAFKPVIQRSAESDQATAAAALSPTTGKLTFSFSINVVSTFPSSETILCIASAQVFDAAHALTIEEEASTTASRSGSKATCTVNIPYSWPLASASQDMVSMEYTIVAGAGNITTLTSAGRSSTQSLPSIKVPSSGSTTSQTISATI